MKLTTRIIASTAAAAVLFLSDWTAADSQQTLQPPSSSGSVAPIFAGAPPPTAPPVVLSRRPSTLHEREDRLDVLLAAGLRDGSIKKSAGAAARLELDSIRHAEDRLRHRHNGELTDADAFALDGRLEKVSEIVRGRPSGEP
jgi:hypothetical protein